MNPTVQLTRDESEAAMSVAKRRNSLNGGQTNIPGGEMANAEARLKQHFVACLAEIAAAKNLNRYWSGCGKGSTGLKDVGGFLEVRSITEMGRGLLVRPKDDPQDPYGLIFVTPELSCHLLGWAYGYEVIAHGRALDQNTQRPCWILSSEQLRPWDELIHVRGFRPYSLRAAV